MKRFLALAVIAAALALAPAATSLPPEGCAPYADQPWVGAINGYAYFLGGTYQCGGPFDFNAYHFSAKVIKADGTIIKVTNGVAYGTQDLDLIGGPVQCLNANGTAMIVRSHLWIGVSGYSKSAVSDPVTCIRSQGGQGPVQP